MLRITTGSYERTYLGGFHLYWFNY